MASASCRVLPSWPNGPKVRSSVLAPKDVRSPSLRDGSPCHPDNGHRPSPYCPLSPCRSDLGNPVSIAVKFGLNSVVTSRNSELCLKELGETFDEVVEKLFTVCAERRMFARPRPLCPRSAPAPAPGMPSRPWKAPGNNKLFSSGSSNRKSKRSKTSTLRALALNASLTCRLYNVELGQDQLRAHLWTVAYERGGRYLRPSGFTEDCS